LSRVVDPARQAKNIPRAVIGAADLGATARESGALFGAISTAAADITGETTGTAIVSFTQQIRDFFREDKKLVAEKRRAGFEGELSLTERIAFLQGRPEAGERFLDEASFEKTVLGAFETLIRGVDPEGEISASARLFAANLEKIGGTAELAEIGKTILRQLSLDPLETVATLQRTFRTAEEQLVTRDLISAEAGVARAGLTGVLKAAGVTDIERRVAALGFELETDLGRRGAAQAVVDQLSGVLQGMERSLERDVPAATLIMGQVIPTLPTGPLSPRDPTGEEVRIRDELVALIEEIKQLIPALDRNTVAQRAVAESDAFDQGPPAPLQPAGQQLIASIPIADGDTE
jgi:hypothetical protein